MADGYAYVDRPHTRPARAAASSRAAVGLITLGTGDPTVCGWCAVDGSGGSAARIAF